MIIKSQALYDALDRRVDEPIGAWRHYRIEVALAKFHCAELRRQRLLRERP